MDVFDNYAVAFTRGDPDDKEKNDIFTVIYFKDFFADLVPNNYHAQVYKQDQAEIPAFTYFDKDGKGNYELIILLKYTGSIVVTPISMVVRPDSYNARFTA